MVYSSCPSDLIYIKCRGDLVTSFFPLSLQPVAEISDAIKLLNIKREENGLPKILIHTDAAQAIGKIKVDVKVLGVDYLTIVGHKFYAPRIGNVYFYLLQLFIAGHIMFCN